ncbi:MAG TPA: M3 family metallopeptidase [Gammaproteobacteria bacterium]|nr:M3 family metallopeptidase [Gammaproteobacteria bacterium]
MNNAFPTEQLPDFQAVRPETVQANIQNQLDQNRATLKKLLAQTGPFTWDNLMQPLEDMGDALQKKWSPVSHLHAVMETDALRDAYNQTQPLLVTYGTELSQNQDLYLAIKSIADSQTFATLTPAQQKIIENELRDFKLAGVNLPADEKTKLAALEQTLSKASTTFSQHLLDATHAYHLHITNDADIAGLPEQAKQLAIENAKHRNLDGYVFTLDYPSYSTAIRFLNNRPLRETLYCAFTTRASDQGPNAGQWDNTDTMETVLKTRHAIANLVGFPNFAAYSLATKMAKKPEDVLHFLTDLLKRSKPIAEKEMAEVIALAKKDGVNDLQAWDVPYYSEKLQEATFEFTQEDLRPYFPVHKALSGMFTIIQQLYDIHIQEEPSVKTWHTDAKFFSIKDKHGAWVGGFYIDLYARPHKRDGAWMDECRVRKQVNDDLQLPIAYLTCNFMRPINNQPALLTHDDVVTLFHEFGHCLHHLLTTVKHPSVAGINGVPWDAVEFPSQFMENFCWERASLDLIAEHFETGEPLPDHLYQKMLSAKHFQTGMQMVRQLEFSLFDFRLHLNYQPNEKNQVQRVLDETRKETAVLTTPVYNRFQHSFSHIFAGGYGAGYYSYKWAEVLSADAYAAFEEEGIFNASTGQRFKDNVLAVGGVRDPLISFKAFRGREPQIDALLRHSGILPPSVHAHE